MWFDEIDRNYVIDTNLSFFFSGAGAFFCWASFVAWACVCSWILLLCMLSRQSIILVVTFAIATISFNTQKWKCCKRLERKVAYLWCTCHHWFECIFLLLCPSRKCCFDRYLDDTATKEVDVRGALFNLTQRIFKAFCNIGPRFSHLAGGLKFISNSSITSEWLTNLDTLLQTTNKFKFKFGLSWLDGMVRSNSSLGRHDTGASAFPWIGMHELCFYEHCQSITEWQFCTYYM